MDFSAADGRYALTAIPDGIEGIRVTLNLMRRMVRESRTLPQMRQLADGILSGVEAKNAAAEVEALRTWIMGNIRYTQDVHDVEMLQTPLTLLHSMAGDCDDQATLMATLAECVGYKTRFAAVAFTPDNFEHVFTEVLLGTRWIPAETTEQVPLGWYPPGVVSRMTVNI